MPPGWIIAAAWAPVLLLHPERKWLQIVRTRGEENKRKRPKDAWFGSFFADSVVHRTACAARPPLCSARSLSAQAAVVYGLHSGGLRFEPQRHPRWQLSQEDAAISIVRKNGSDQWSISKGPSPTGLALPPEMLSKGSCKEDDPTGCEPLI